MGNENTFPERLETLLKERGITQLELAARVGVTRAAMSRYVSGDREPRFATLLRIAQELEVDLDELLVNDIPSEEAVLRRVARTHFSAEARERLLREIDGGEKS